MKKTRRDRLVALLKMLRVNRFAARAVYGLEGFKSANESVLRATERALEAVRVGCPTGDYLEFGVFKGYSLLHTQRVASRMGLTEMRFFGFDSFAGLPEEPEQSRAVFYQGQYRCSEDKVRRWLSEGGADWDRMTLVPGFYDRTLTAERKRTLGLSTCAVAMLDCDIYSSTKLALAWIDDLLQPGSIVVLDDWDAYGDDSHSWRDGQRRAMREHQPTSRWVFETLFRYGAGLRGGQAFRVQEPTGVEAARK